MVFVQTEVALSFVLTHVLWLQCGSSSGNLQKLHLLWCLHGSVKQIALMEGSYWIHITEQVGAIWKLPCSRITHICSRVCCSTRTTAFWVVAFPGEILETFLDNLTVVAPLSLVHCRTRQLHIMFLDIDAA